MSALALVETGEDPAMGLELPEEQSFEQWVDMGKRLCAGAKVVNWWIGDWWAAGSHRYGARAKAAAEGIFGREFQTLMNLASVCRAFEASRRREVLSFGHHEVVAALAPAEADYLLNETERNRWSVRDLRDAAAMHRGATGRIPSWMPDRREAKKFDRPAAIEAIYQRLFSAARDGQICPTADELLEISDAGSVSTTVALMHILEDEGRIKVQRFQRGRVVEITATGETTAQPGDTTPHWRELSRDMPAPSVEAVERSKPTIAAQIFSAARRKGKSPQDYLLELVWLGWEVECARGDSAPSDMAA